MIADPRKRFSELFGAGKNLTQEAYALVTRDQAAADAVANAGSQEPRIPTQHWLGQRFHGSKRERPIARSDWPLILRTALHRLKAKLLVHAAVRK